MSLLVHSGGRLRRLHCHHRPRDRRPRRRRRRRRPSTRRLPGL